MQMPALKVCTFRHGPNAGQAANIELCRSPRGMGVVFGAARTEA